MQNYCQPSTTMPPALHANLNRTPWPAPAAAPRRRAGRQPLAFLPPADSPSKLRGLPVHASGRDTHWSCSADAPPSGGGGAARREAVAARAGVPALFLSLLVLLSSPDGARALDLSSADAQLVRPCTRWRAASSGGV